MVPLRRDPLPTPAAPAPTPPPRDPVAEELALLLGSPNGASPPELPALESLEHVGIRDRQLADVLHDAIAHLAIDWG